MSSDSSLFESESDKQFFGAARVGCRKRLTADELGIQIDDESDPGLIRRSRVLCGMEILARKEKPRLQP